MRVTTTQTNDAWKAAWKGGEDRPMQRATIQLLNVRSHPYDLMAIQRMTAFGPISPWGAIDFRGNGVFTTAVLGQDHQPIELPNIKSISWNRSVKQDIATCTITLWNTETLPLGGVPDDDGMGFERPGYFTFNRGVSAASQSKWLQETNGWRDMIMPDRIIRTYEGYGFDAEVAPELDPHMYPSGVWLIDDVVFDAFGTITVTCRDIGRVLVDQLMFPPVVPFAQYPMTWSAFHQVKNPDIAVPSTDWTRPSYETDSNIPYIGRGISDGGVPYVSGDGSVRGHHGSHAVDADPTNTYWMSVGNYPSWSSAYEYVQGAFSARHLQAVKFKAWGGPYTYFISVMVNGVWQGRTKVPYRYRMVDTNADIMFLAQGRVGKDQEITVPMDVPDATKVRITFTDLYDTGIGTYRWRAGLRDFQISSQTITYVDGGYHVEGNYGDYTDIIKYLCCWGGFFWPTAQKPEQPPELVGNNVTLEDGTTVYYTAPGNSDPVLPTGYTWGFLENTYTAGKVDLGIEIWDKKPVMDGISYIRDIVSFLFYIDELGRVIWRMPNIWAVGNYVYTNSMSSPARTSTIIEIDEKETLLGLSAKVSSRSVREKIFVANVNGKFGAMAQGFNPAPSGIRRIAGWCVDTDTQILTKRGWLRYDEVRAGDETLSIDQATGKSVWQVIKGIEVFDDIERKMYAFEANNFSALTTPDHRWLVQTVDSRTGEKRWNWRTSETLGNMDRIPRSLPRQDAPVTALHSDALVELVAWIFSEGSVRNRSITISQSQVANPANCARIRGLMAGLFDDGWSESKPRRAGEITWRLGAKASALVVPHLGAEKAPTMEFLCSLTQDQLDLFIDVCILGDGHVRRTTKSSKTESRFFYQQVGPRLDAFIAACALAGQATSYQVTETGQYANSHTKHDKAAVTLVKGQDYLPCAKPNRQPEIVRHEGIVWCPTMPEHHTWLARRGGSVYFTGNTDQNFQTEAECQVMADLIAIRSMFTYRANSLDIPGNPAIQIDDQVRIYERTTAETYVHYVDAITSEFDMSTGRWTYSLETHWLGEEPFNKWAFDPYQLSQETIEYLKLIGKLPS